MMDERDDIIPAMKVGRFLELYPELEETLVNLSPQFAKLRNPALRRTVARIVTLRQAAATGGLDPAELVNFLRRAAGQPPLQVADGTGDFGGDEPDWMRAGYPVTTFDATEIINSGGTPLAEILAHIDVLAPRSVYELVTPILPVPIIERIRKKGLSSWTVEHDGVFRTFFCRHPG